MLIVIGGAATVLWDTWLAQKVGKAKAKYESKRKRARDEAGDAEEIIPSQDVQPAQELQVRRPEAVKRRVQTGSSADHIAAEEISPSEPDRPDSRRNAESETASIAPVADVKTHNISIKVGVSLVAGFFGEYTCGRFESS